MYYDEVAYLFCDGYAINNGYYSVYPNIGGTFYSTKDIHDQGENPVNFRFSVRGKLRRLIENITIEIDGLADTKGFIDTFTDADESSVNGYFIPGDQFIINGSRIKVAGDAPDIGVYFVPIEYPSKAMSLREAEREPMVRHDI